MYIAKAIQGLEDIAADEVKGEVILPQTVLFKKQKKEYRTISVVYELMKRFTFSSSEDVVKEIASLNNKLEKKKRYQLVCSRKGDHPFKSMDIVKEAGMMLREKGLTVDYKDYEKTVYIDVIDNNCLIGILLKDNLCKRPYRIKHNNKSISACIAAALIKIAGAKKTDTILDPFCKDAIIPIEACKQKIKNVHAIDSLKNNIRNAAINCKFAKTNIMPKCYEINWLDTLFKKGSVNHIITNILLSKHDNEPEKLLKEFFHQADFVVKDAITIITNKPDLIKNDMRPFTNIMEKKVSVGEMNYAILKLVRNKSQ